MIMEKLSENYKIGCYYDTTINYTSNNCIFTKCGIPGQYMRCDMSKLAARLKKYEDLDMTPDEIREMKKALMVKDAYISELERIRYDYLSLMGDSEKFKRLIDSGLTIGDYEDMRRERDEYKNQLTHTLDEIGKLAKRFREYKETIESIRNMANNALS